MDTDATGRPRISPKHEDAVALVLRTATENGWTISIEGLGSWMPSDRPSDLVLTTRRLGEITYLNPADLVATAQAGIPWEVLRHRLADQGTWIGVDPPGGDRSVGSVVATGTAGPLRAGLGGVRDHLVGLTLVTGDGRIVKAGGRVVKNVAGYDLTKLACGSFGAFGIITAVHLRLRAVPREDITLLARGARDALLHEARSLLEAGTTSAALELLSPRATGERDWTLAVRLMGTPAAARHQRDAVQASLRRTLDPLDARAAAAFWQGVPARPSQEPSTIRLGAVPTALDDALDLLAHHLSAAHDLSGDWVSVTVPAGTVRWCGAASPDRLRLLRYAAAQREMPLTVERAPWPVLQSVGHFGAYREGVARLVERLRLSFDPANVLVSASGDRP